MNLRSSLKRACINALSQAYDYAALTEISHLLEITEATSEEFGDYQCNAALKLAKQFKESPLNIAQKMAERLKADAEVSNIVSSIEVKAPGFINFRIQAQYLIKKIDTYIHGTHFGIELIPKPEKVVIDFSSPNIAKEMHVGHLRSTIIGDCLRRLFLFFGFDVIPLNHVGDFGTQFGMLIAHLKSMNLTHLEQHTDEIKLSDLSRWYKEAKQRFDQDPDFKKKSQEEVVALQKGDATNVQIWSNICEISRRAYEHIYSLLDITLIERGESFYQNDLQKILSDLQNKGLITVSDGAKCVYLDGFINREGEPLPLIIQKSDGGFNYAATDLSALHHRIFDEKAKQILYVVDAGQSLHFQMVFATAQKAGYYDSQKIRVEHVPFGLVLRADGKKFKTREGDTERLIDLIQTGIDKARKILVDRDPNLADPELQHMAEVLGINAIKYSDLSCNRMSDYVFSYDKMLAFEGNTAAFIMYAYVRILSIQRKTKVDIEALIQAKTPLNITEPAEISLALRLEQYSEVLTQMSQDLMPSRLTEYLYRLAEKFHHFFHQCRVEGVQEQNSRLLLCEATARVLKSGMQILGLQPLERM